MCSVVGHVAKRRRRKEIANDVRRGLSIEQAAKKHGVTMASVRETCRGEGVYYGGKRKKNTILKILARLLKGQETLTQISRRREVLRTRAFVHEVATNAKMCGIPIDKRYRA